MFGILARVPWPTACVSRAADTAAPRAFWYLPGTAAAVRGCLAWLCLSRTERRRAELPRKTWVKFRCVTGI